MFNPISAKQFRLRLYIVVLLVCGQAVAIEEQPTLLELSKSLECSATSSQASELLHKFRNIELPGRSLPNEWFSSGKPPSLHAASLDIVLASLVSTSERHPELTLEIEKVILQWSYCEVLLDNKFYDFVSVDGRLEKQIADDMSPINWHGFYQVGFLGDHDDRFVIEKFKHDDAPLAFYELNYSTLFRQQCLPHPQTSKLFYSADTYFPGRVTQDGYRSTVEYPYQWKAGCNDSVDGKKVAVIDEVEKAAIDAVKVADVFVPNIATILPAKPSSINTASELELNELAVNIASVQSLINFRDEIALMQQSVVSIASDSGNQDHLPQLGPVQERESVVSVMVTQKDDDTFSDVMNYYSNYELYGIQLKNAPIYSPEVHIASHDEPNMALIHSVQSQYSRPVNTPNGTNKNQVKSRALEPLQGILSAVTTVSTAPTAPTAPIVSTIPTAPTVPTVPTVPIVVESGGVAPSILMEPLATPEIYDSEQVVAKPTDKIFGLSGAITLANTSLVKDGFRLSGNISYKFIKNSYWFIRSSGNYKFDIGQYRYTWGIGYDDWHPGTFSVQLNHWGPLVPGDYLDIDNAVASVTYKFQRSNFMNKVGLSSSVTISQKLSGDPIFSWSNSWSPKGDWFLRSTISQPLKGGDASWSYGFGNANYSPFTFSLEYNNWGYNKAFEHNFKDNGVLAFTYRWRY